MRAKAMTMLDSLQRKLQWDAVVRVQALHRCRIGRRDYLKKRMAAVHMQRVTRGGIAREKFGKELANERRKRAIREQTRRYEVRPLAVDAYLALLQ